MAIATDLSAETTSSDNLIHTYTNPMDFSIADPFVLQDGKTYYMYGTTDNAPGQGFDVYKSPDLVTWTRAGKCYTPTSNSWGQRNFWAPEVIKRDGRYYMHYTCFSPHEGKRNICVARSESPEGPFIDFAGPLFPDRSVIDSHIYHDKKSGNDFIYISPENDPPSKIIGATISADFKSILTSPTVCLESEYGWEDQWIEGPIIHEHNGTLYMLYSGGAYWEPEYSLGCATAQSPLGPWKKSKTNPVLHANDAVEGTGHNGLAWSPDGTELFLVYHAHASDWSQRRVAALDRIVFKPVKGGPDLLTIPGAPTSTPQPLPSGAPPSHSAQSDDFSSAGLNTSQWHVFNNYEKGWGLKDGHLEIAAFDGDYWRSHNDGRNVFLQHAPTGDFSIETRVNMDAARINEQAFLTVWYDQDNYVTLATGRIHGQQFAVTRELKGKANVGLAPNDVGWPVCLRIEKRGNTLKFYASKDGKTWKTAGRDADCRLLNARYVGLGAWSPGSERNTNAIFDWFKVLP